MSYPGIVQLHIDIEEQAEDYTINQIYLQQGNQQLTETNIGCLMKPDQTVNLCNNFRLFTTSHKSEIALATQIDAIR